jgi:hypothetical protein
LPEKSDNATEDPSQQESDSFDKDFAELAALVGYDATAKPEAKPEANNSPQASKPAMIAPVDGVIRVTSFSISRK